MIVDAHLDLAYNALNFARDLRRPLADLRAAEPPGGHPDRGLATVTLPALRAANVGVVVATLFVPPVGSKAAMAGRRIAYQDAAEAHGHARRQIDYYRRLADDDATIRLVGSRADLSAVRASHAGADGAGAAPAPLLGIVPLMEGADPIRVPEETEEWFEYGVRVIGPAWADTAYSPGAWGDGGGLPDDGRRLLEIMADLDLILDVSHMAEKAALDAIEFYEGTVVATHCNARALVPGARQLSDTQVRRLAERDGVIGVVLFNAFLRRGYTSTDRKELVTLDHVVAHIDHMCQVLGTAAHVGLGSDFDGGFGAEHIPAELDDVTDLPRVGAALLARGYEPTDVAAIMGGNWLRLLERALPG